MEDSGEVVPPHAAAFGDQGGRRRADVTAVDLGYTGRRAKPDPEYHDENYDHEDNGNDGYNDNYWEAGFSDVQPGYPGWAEADERHGGRSWRGRDDTGGW